MSALGWFFLAICLSLIYYGITQYQEFLKTKALKDLADKALQDTADTADKAPTKVESGRVAKVATNEEIIKNNFIKAFEDQKAKDAKSSVADEKDKANYDAAKAKADAIEAKARADTKAAADAKAKADADAAAANKAKAEADAKAKDAADAKAKADADALAAKKAQDEKAAAEANEAQRIADKNAYEALIQKQEADKKAAAAAAEQKQKEKEKAAQEENLKALAVMAAAAVVDEINRAAVKAIFTKAGRQQAAKLAYKGAAVGLKLASQVLSKLGLKSAEKLAAFGLKAGTKAAQIAGQEALEKLAKEAGKSMFKAVGGAAIKEAVKAPLKSFFYMLPALGQAMMAYDILSAGLDIGDGGGYGKMGTIKQYKNMKEEAEKQLQIVFEEAGVLKPSFKGPNIDYSIVIAELEKRMSDPENPMMKEMTLKMRNKINEDIENNVIQPDDLSKEEVLANYTSLIDVTLIQNQIIKEMCEKNGGKVVDIADPMSMYEPIPLSKQNGKLITAFSQKSLAFCEIECQKAKCKSFTHREAVDENDFASNCSLYSDVTQPVDSADSTVYNKIKDIPDNMGLCTFTKEACDKSYSWPLKEEEEYGEFKPAKILTNVNGKIVETNQDMCVSTDSMMRTVCDSNNIPYDQKTGICKIDKAYCQMKGADWIQDEKTKEFDCAVSPGQGFAEAIFGTTITRGLKQVFDLSQYEACKPNETDDGYFCRNTNACDPAKNEEQCLGLCYPKCRKGFHPVGCNICSPDCPPSTADKVITDDGAFCRSRTCKAGQELSGELCYPKCKPNYDGVGPVCWEKCAPGWTDDGAFCRRAGYCEPNEDRNGALCYPKCKPGYDGVGPVCWEKCAPGWTDDGAFCRRAGYCEPNEDRNGALCYPKCKPGYDGVGPVCWEKCAPGWTDDGAFCRRAGYCEANEDRNGALCYPKCKPGYDGVGPVCWEQCPKGYTDDGAFCRETSCPAGYTDHGLTCTDWNAGYYNKSWGSVGCTGGRPFRFAGYDDCYSTWISAAKTIGKKIITKKTYGRGVGTPDTKIVAKKTEGRGVGTPDTKIVAKKTEGRGVGTPDTKITAKKSEGRGFGEIPTIKIDAKAAPEGRGFGTPAVTIRTKQRIVPYSTKQNALRMNMNNAPVKEPFKTEISLVGIF